MTEVSGVNVEVDILDSALMDVTRMDGVFKVLLWGAARGRIRAFDWRPAEKVPIWLTTRRREPRRSC